MIGEAQSLASKLLHAGLLLVFVGACLQAMGRLEKPHRLQVGA